MLDGNLVEYIKTSITQGSSKEDIYKTLLGEGRNVDEIQKAFNPINTEKGKKDSQKRTIHIVVTIGAILIGAGIFSFVASNWQGMGKVVKIIIVITAMLTSYGLGWSLKEKRGYSKTGGAFIFLGAIIFGAGIFLVGQMFNIRLNWPDGFILWMLGTIAMAFATEIFSLFSLAVLVGAIAVAAHPLIIFTDFNPFLFTSSLLLLIATVVTFTTGVVMHKKIKSEVV